MSYHDSTVEIEKRHYYSSSHDPFHNANNIMMFFGGGDRGKIVSSVIRALRNHEPIVRIYGERGSGKTMLSLVIDDRLTQTCNTIRYDLPDISESLLLRHLLIELCPQNAGLISAAEAREGAGTDVIEKALDAITRQLSDTSAAQNRKPYVLTIDSAAKLDKKTIRIVKHITRENEVGLPRMYCLLYRRSKHEQMASGKHRHGYILSPNKFWLRRLTLSETSGYLAHHMMLFDFNRKDMFSREMTYFIADRSEGVIRAINKISRDAFTIANLEGAEQVSMSHLLMAGLPPRFEPSLETGFLSRHRAGVVALMGSCVVVSVAAAVILLR